MVVGATFVGPQVGELLHAATIAIVGKVPLDTLWHAVPAFPTVSEVLAAAARGRPGTVTAARRQRRWQSGVPEGAATHADSRA